MVPRFQGVLAPVPRARRNRLRRHLIAALRAVAGATAPSAAAPPATGFAARVVQAACALCEGWCCRNGGDDAYLDERVLARLMREQPGMRPADVLRLYAVRIPELSYEGSCVFHGGQGCTLDRSLRSDVCNRYYCGGLEGYLATGAEEPVIVLAGERDHVRASPILVP